jgi:hypothetical protein
MFYDIENYTILLTFLLFKFEGIIPAFVGRSPTNKTIEITGMDK